MCGPLPCSRQCQLQVQIRDIMLCPVLSRRVLFCDMDRQKIKFKALVPKSNFQDSLQLNMFIEIEVSIEINSLEEGQFCGMNLSLSFPSQESAFLNFVARGDQNQTTLKALFQEFLGKIDEFGLFGFVGQIGCWPSSEINENEIQKKYERKNTIKNENINEDFGGRGQRMDVGGWERRGDFEDIDICFCGESNGEGVEDEGCKCEKNGNGIVRERTNQGNCFNNLENTDQQYFKIGEKIINQNIIIITKKDQFHQKKIKLFNNETNDRQQHPNNFYIHHGNQNEESQKKNDTKQFLFSKLEKQTEFQKINSNYEQQMPFVKCSQSTQNHLTLSTSSIFKPIQKPNSLIPQFQPSQTKNPQKCLQDPQKLPKTSSTFCPQFINFGIDMDQYSKPMSKNANLPKFLIRIFTKYIEKYKSFYNKKQYDRLISECKMLKSYKKQNAFGLKHLKFFFMEGDEGFPSPKINRKVIGDIIRKFLLGEICQNSQIPRSHLIGYLMACKVYAIRCRNSILVTRMQSK